MCEVNPFSRKNFQYAKGIAILAVIFSHIGNFSGKTWLTPLGGIGVAVFLFCSGYGVMCSYYKNGLKNFWKNKIITIWIPFAIVEILSAFIHCYSVSDVVLELAFLKNLNALGWYMQYLAVCYLLFYFTVRFVQSTAHRFAIWGVCAIASFVFLPNLQGEQALSYIAGLYMAEKCHCRQLGIKNTKILAGGGYRIIAFCNISGSKATTGGERGVSAFIYRIESGIEKLCSNRHYLYLIGM